MSPILLRPSREQDEHDRLARHLEGKYARRKFEVFVNVRDEQLMPVKIGPLTLYPDLVLGENRKLAGVVEIETGESVNNLEVLAQWVHFGKARVPFHLYVPANMYEASRRLADTYGARITEIWTYRGAVDGFDLVRMYADTAAKFPKPSVVLRPNPPKPAPVPAPAPPVPSAPAAGAGAKGDKAAGKGGSAAGRGAEQRKGTGASKAPAAASKGAAPKPAPGKAPASPSRQKTPARPARAAGGRNSTGAAKAISGKRPAPVKAKGGNASKSKGLARPSSAARKGKKR